MTPLQNLQDAFTRMGRAVTYAAAPVMGALGTPVVADPLVPEGQARMTSEPRAVHVGIPSRNATDAALIVREHMADTLAWLGEPVRPFHLQVAARHYAQQDTP